MPARLVKLTFKTQIRRDSAGVPRVPADFVAEQGQLVRILDVRDDDDLRGPLGHIPSVTHVPLAELGEVPRVLDKETCIVVVSARGGRAGTAARYLEELGMQNVAAMDGGMVAWKQLGFTTLRDEDSYRKTLVALAPGIGRDGRPLVTLEPGARLTASLIADHVGHPTSVRWVKLGAFLLHGKRSCVDGRDDQGVIGTPGGDAGELLLALAAAEVTSGRALSNDEIERVLLHHIDTFGRFYMHTDVGALNQLISAYRSDERIAPFIAHIASPEAWGAFHARVPEVVQGAVLEYLTVPGMMGCGHLRFAMTEPEYQVRPELARAFLRAFHRLRWAGAPELEWVILGGTHAEAGVVNVIVEGDLHTYTRVPLVSPAVGNVQLFVNHPQVTRFMRAEVAASLCELGIGDATPERLAAAIDELGAAQAASTLRRLARGLPVFEIQFDRAGEPRVEARGTVDGG